MSNSASVLVVEDDETLREALCDTIQYGGYRVVSAGNGVEALKSLETETVDMVISDVQMDVMDGHTLLRKVKSVRPELPFVLVTAHGTIAKAVEAMREGATDYLIKPFEAEVLLEMVSRLEMTGAGHATGMVAEDPGMVSVCELARRVATTPATVLISGESGTGKEVVARYIHEHSSREQQPFVALNCAAIPEAMLESILFGYEKGAYTGAHQSRAGKFEQASGGTLLLDEISEMDLGLQAKLLRVLQEKEVERLGGNTLIPLDVRVLATTNRNLREEVACGRFREDLYYRLNVFPVRIPALRERPRDILPLARVLLQRHAQDRSMNIAPEAELCLLAHDWKGNVRELENCMHRAAIMASSDQITAADIYFEDTITPDPERHAQTSDNKALLDGGLRDKEKQLIVNALKTVAGRRKDAAKLLGISPRTLRYKLARLKEQGVTIPAVG
ncbi:MAG: sigma-54-dependent Fis family transcriptional regulator [Gammaproteobacteria bacterium]|nr:MAG: sigma-54-dependent Fis family transcriptional regulator [Gammaproteobacteria bacterium]HDY83920.1 sigma-54-dependent Fis family transcriptional regulator [Halieaceae bacterium]